MLAATPCQLDGASFLVAIMLNEVRSTRALIQWREATARASRAAGTARTAPVPRVAAVSGARPPGRLLAWLGASLLAACSVPPIRPPVQSYVCEQGQRFSLQVDAAGQRAVIDIDGMRFALLREAGRPEAFSCSMVRIERRGDEATVAMDGQPSHTGCRRQPARH